MNAPVPGPTGVDPEAVRARVDAALGEPVDVDALGATELAEQAGALDELHRALSAALDTIDRV